MVRSILLAPALAALAFAAAAPPGHGPSAPRVVTIVASEFHFMAPASVPAGRTTFRLVNHGQQVHHVTLIRLNEGKTVADLEAAFKQPGPPPAWAVLVGGPNAANPGGQQEDVVELQAGNYAIVCFVPDADGVPHVMKGMAQALTVTPAESKSAPPARYDRTLKLADYGFILSAPLTAGTHHVLVQNGALQPHEIVLIRLAPDKHAKDFMEWAAGGMQTAPPGSFEGGASPMAPGMDNVATLNLRPGRYLMVCFLEDGKDGKPHFVHGMIQEFAVN